MKRLIFALEILVSVGGLVVGTVTVCAPVPDAWGLVLWTLSVVSLVRLLCINRRKDSHTSSSLVLRGTAAGLFMFSVVIVTAMGPAAILNPAALAREDWIALTAVAVVGTISGGLAIKLSGV